MSRLRVFRGAGAFERARQQLPGNQMVCGVVLESGQPAYFHADKDAPDDEIQATAFRLRHGRDIGEGERQFIAALHRHQNRVS
jgi:hypothetical protein